MTDSKPNDEQWIAAYKKGDVSALSGMVEHYRKPLFAFIYNMCQGRGDAEEIFQEVWLRAIKNMHAYRDKNFIGWLFRIAHNLFIDSVRREKRFLQPIALNDGPSVIDQVPSREHAPDYLAADRDLGLRIQNAIRQLPDDQREVFLMRTEADLSFKEIAAIQKTTLNTALGRMHYALNKLRPLLHEDYQMITGGNPHE